MKATKTKPVNFRTKIAKAMLRIPDKQFALDTEAYVRQFDKMNCLKPCAYKLGERKVEP